MIPDFNAPHPRLLSVLVAVALGSLSSVALADPSITLSASYALNGGPTMDGLIDPAASLSGGPFPSNTGGDYYLNKSASTATDTSSVFFHTYGYTGSSTPTYFGARASGSGSQFFATTASLYSATFTNASAAAVALNFGFNVDGGEVGLFGTGVGSAELLLRIRRDGIVVSQGDTKIVQTAVGVSCIETDVGSLGAWSSCGSATANSVYGAGGAFSVDMGLVAAGATITIDYDIVSTVSGQYLDGAQSSGNCNAYGGYAKAPGEAAQAAIREGGGQCVSYNGIARSGDPFNNDGLGNTANFSLDAVNTVPEPGSLALLGAAAGGWWLSRRRQGRGQAG